MDDIIDAVARWLWPPKRPTDPLDKTVLRWTPHDPFTVRDLLNGVCITGRTGSGKTSSSGRCLANAIIRLHSGGLILGSKPEDAEMWRRQFAAARRADDLLIFSTRHDLRLNFLEYAMRSGADTRELVRCLMVIAETLRSSDAKGGEDKDFWEQEQARMLHNAIEVIRQATGTVSAPEIQKFITGAASTPDQTRDEGWRNGHHSTTLGDAFNRPDTTDMERHDLDLAVDYFVSEWPSMASRTRSSIAVGAFGLLHTFNTGVVRQLVSTTTNVSPDDILAGKWVLVDMPISEYGDSGALVMAGWKYLTQRRVLRRAAQPGDKVVVIWADEAQGVVNSYDAHYAAQSRSHLGTTVYLTQSLHSYNSALKGESGRSQVEALLTNFGHKIFHCLGDAKSAEWASSLLGKQLQTFIGSSVGPPSPEALLWEELIGPGRRLTSSTSENYAPTIQTSLFMNGPRCGGAANGYLCDAFVVKSGESFVSNGANWLLVSFSQKD